MEPMGRHRSPSNHEPEQPYTSHSEHKLGDLHRPDPKQRQPGALQVEEALPTKKHSGEYPREKRAYQHMIVKPTNPKPYKPYKP